MVTARYDWKVHEPPPFGLCEHCRHRRDVESATSRFVLCTRSFSDPAFPKYPRLPVLSCAGYESLPSGQEQPGRAR